MHCTDIHFSHLCKPTHQSHKTQSCSQRVSGAITIAAPSPDQAGTSSLHQSEFHYQAKQVTIYYAPSTSSVLKRKGALCQHSRRDRAAAPKEEQNDQHQSGTQKDVCQRVPIDKDKLPGSRQGTFCKTHQQSKVSAVH